MSRSRYPSSLPRAAIASVVVLVAATVAACSSNGGSSDTGGRARIVVSHAVLGAAVSELVGEAATVEVVLPDGADPHEFRPSAKDVEAIQRADFVVVNGLDLEPGLVDAVAAAREDGVPVFTATDHVEVRRFGAAEVTEEADHDGDAAADEPDDGGADDPHFWVDPTEMRAVVDALAADLESTLGLDLGDRPARLGEELDQLDRRVEEMLAVIPPARRLLVTGHESMGYFARRYGFELVGALIPSTTTQAAPSAADLADLRSQIEELGVPAIFNEVGTPPALSEAIAEETGVVVVELPTHTLPDDRSYATFMEIIGQRVVDGLGSGT